MISAEAQRVLEEQIIGGDMKALFREEKIYRRLLKENVLREGIDIVGVLHLVEGRRRVRQLSPHRRRCPLLAPSVAHMRGERRGTALRRLRRGGVSRGCAEHRRSLACINVWR